MTRSAWFWSQVAVVLITAALAFSAGWQTHRRIAESAAPPEAVGAGPVASERPPAPPALRCAQEVTFDAKNTPIDAARAWTQQEAEGRLHAAQMSLRSAEAHGVWTDLGRRWAQLAAAQFAEVALCKP